LGKSKSKQFSMLGVDRINNLVVRKNCSSRSEWIVLESGKMHRSRRFSKLKDRKKRIETNQMCEYSHGMSKVQNKLI